MMERNEKTKNIATDKMRQRKREQALKEKEGREWEERKRRGSWREKKR